MEGDTWLLEEGLCGTLEEGSMCSYARPLAFSYSKGIFLGNSLPQSHCAPGESQAWQATLSLSCSQGNRFRPSEKAASTCCIRRPSPSRKIPACYKDNKQSWGEQIRLPQNRWHLCQSVVTAVAIQTKKESLEALSDLPW